MLDNIELYCVEYVSGNVNVCVMYVQHNALHQVNVDSLKMVGVTICMLERPWCC